MVKTIRVDHCRLHESKKAKSYNHTFMDYLHESIRLKSVMFPILVKINEHNGYDVIDGSARVIVCRHLGIETIPARIIS